MAAAASTITIRSLVLREGSHPAGSKSPPAPTVRLRQSKRARRGGERRFNCHGPQVCGEEFDQVTHRIATPPLQAQSRQGGTIEAPAGFSAPLRRAIQAAISAPRRTPARIGTWVETLIHIPKTTDHARERKPAARRPASRSGNPWSNRARVRSFPPAEPACFQRAAVCQPTVVRHAGQKSSREREDGDQTDGKQRGGERTKSPGNKNRQPRSRHPCNTGSDQSGRPLTDRPIGRPESA